MLLEPLEQLITLTVVLMWIVAIIMAYLGPTTIGLWIVSAFTIVATQLVHVTTAFKIHLDQEDLELEGYLN